MNSTHSLFQDSIWSDNDEHTWVGTCVVLFTEKNENGVWTCDKAFPFVVTQMERFEQSEEHNMCAFHITFMTQRSPVMQKLLLQHSGINFTALTQTKLIVEDEPLITGHVDVNARFTNSYDLIGTPPHLSIQAHDSLGTPITQTCDASSSQLGMTRQNQTTFEEAGETINDE